MKKGKKTMLAFGVLIVLLLFAGFLMAHFQQKNSRSILSVEELAISEASLDEHSLSIQGSILASAKSYRGYHYTIKQNDVYIQIEGGVVTKKYPSGDFNITIEDPDLKNVKAVYIKSKNQEKVVYPK
ncbi:MULTISPECIES: hypothetical protein [Saccharibacillus]|uniref:hypothetical protein n=1 Tax=Saccharibacillus TaxID=456492 RepID=UPI00123C57BF|nr:hypothetical protein [Saccharibacillus sp. WB 17]MWJ30310.1 hypothetical protein [Saccharibacillus sp. WB 17]